MAVDMNDIEKLQEIHAKYDKKTTSAEAPSICESISVVLLRI